MVAQHKSDKFLLEKFGVPDGVNEALNPHQRKRITRPPVFHRPPPTAPTRPFGMARHSSVTYSLLKEVPGGNLMYKDAPRLKVGGSVQSTRGYRKAPRAPQLIPAGQAAAAPVIVRRATTMLNEPCIRVLLLVEYCQDSASASVRHDPEKYQRYFEQLKAAFEGKTIPSPDADDERRTIEVDVRATPTTWAPVWSGGNRDGWFKMSDTTLKQTEWPPALPPAEDVLGQSVRFDPHAGAGEDDVEWNRELWFGEHRPVNVSFATARPTRLGAFEIYLVTKDFGEPKCYQLYSKLASRCWPNIDSVVKRCGVLLRRCFGDWTLGDLLMAPTVEQSELRAKLEVFKADANPEWTQQAHAKIDALKVVDGSIEEAMTNKDPDVLRDLLRGIDELSASVSVRAAGHVQDEYNNQVRQRADEAITEQMSASAEALDQDQLRSTIEAKKTEATDELTDRARAFLAELQTADANILKAMEDQDECRTLLLNDDTEIMSAKVRAAALQRLAEYDAATNTADGALLQLMNAPADQVEHATLRAKLDEVTVEASQDRIERTLHRLNELQAMDQKVTKAMPDPDELRSNNLDETVRMSHSVRSVAKTQRDKYDAAETELESVLMAPVEKVEQSVLRSKMEELNDLVTRGLMERARARLQDLQSGDDHVLRAVKGPDTLQAVVLDDSELMSASVREKAKAKRVENDAADTKLAALLKTQPEDTQLVAAMQEHLANGTTPVRQSAEQKLNDIRNANRALRTAMAANPLEATDLASALSQHGDWASNSVETAGEATLAVLETADVALRDAMTKLPPAASDLLEALAEHGQRASRSIATTAFIQAQDAALRAAIIVMPVEAQELRTALTKHGPDASAGARLEMEQKLAIVEPADTLLRLALTEERLEAKVLESSFARSQAQASASVCAEVQKRLETLNHADAQLTEAAAKAIMEAAELQLSFTQHGAYASASVADRVSARLDQLNQADAFLMSGLVASPLEADELDALKLAHAMNASAEIQGKVEEKLASLRLADATLTAMSAKLPREALEHQEALTMHRKYASNSVGEDIERRFASIQAADSALTAALVAVPLEASDMTLALEQHGQDASNSTRTEVEKKLARLQSADEAIKVAMSMLPLEAEHLQEALDQHGLYASESVRFSLVLKMDGPSTSATALRALLAQDRLDATEIVSALDEHGSHASASVKAEVKRKLASLREADLALIAAAATTPLEAVDLKEALTRHGLYASTSTLEAVTATLDHVLEADTALKGAMAKARLDASELQGLLVNFDVQASPSVRQGARTRLATMHSADATLKVALTKARLEADELKTVLVESGPYGSASLTDTLAERVASLKEADGALRTALAKVPLEVEELKAARDEHATAAGTRMREESRFKVAQMEEADAAIEAAIAKTTNDKADLIYTLGQHGSRASARLAAQAAWVTRHKRTHVNEVARAAAQTEVCAAKAQHKAALDENKTVEAQLVAMRAEVAHAKQVTKVAEEELKREKAELMRSQRAADDAVRAASSAKELARGVL